MRHFRFGTILDAGCGLGLYSFYLAKKFPHANIDACDIDSKLIETGKRILKDLNLSNVNIFQLDISLLSEIDKYDLIICMDVIDQIEDDSNIISRFYKALKKGGILYLTIPHKRHIKRYFTKFEWISDKRHVRDGYTESEIISLLENNGFKIKRLKNVWGFFGEGSMELYMLALLHLPLPLVALYFLSLLPISSLDMICRNKKGYGLVVIAQK
jgi:2-polyprenyl-3-methyl-5-hydroxy-6-metoxy-1,4-benzoquinol methylase